MRPFEWSTPSLEPGFLGSAPSRPAPEAPRTLGRVPAGGLDFSLTLGGLFPGRRDPCVHLGPQDFWRASWTPDGPGTLHLFARGDRIGARAFGAGGEWLLGRAPAVASLLDRPERFQPRDRRLLDHHRRAHTFVAVCRYAPRLLDASPQSLLARLESLPGIGPWTLAHVRQTHLGDPDAVVVGDDNLPHVVGRFFSGAPRSTDADMLEFLAPFAGQRARAVRWIKSSGVKRVRWRCTVQPTLASLRTAPDPREGRSRGSGEG